MVAGELRIVWGQQNEVCKKYRKVAEESKKEKDRYRLRRSLPSGAGL